MRNNEERFGANNAALSEPPPPSATKTDSSEKSILNFVAPTDFVDLPSKGNFYPVGHPLHGKECLEIRQMTAKDEDILTSTALLKQGIAIERLLQNLIIENININDLLIGDRNAILVKARISAYGSNYETKVQCPVCNQFSEYEFDLNVSVTSGGHTESLENVSAGKENNFIIKLPSSEVDVEVRLLTGEDEKRMAAVAEKNKKYNMPEPGWTDQLKSFLVSVNGITDPSAIENFVNNMPAKDSRHIRKCYSKLVPNIDLTQYFVCTGCYSETKMEVPFTADFFWPR